MIQTSSSIISNTDERSSLLARDVTATMDAIASPTLEIIEQGYGTQDGQGNVGGAIYITGGDASSVEGIHSNATSDTFSSITNVTNVASSTIITNEESQEVNKATINKRHTWLVPFFINIFLACASFSIVMPTLTAYILHINAPLAFLPWVVSSYSAGEMFGSFIIGHYYEYATKTYDQLGSGPKLSMMICLSLGVIGSAFYASAGWIEDDTAAKYCLLVARLIQGIWTGGQQAVEQAYLSAAVHPSERTEYTATLSTCAVLGFIMGPAIGAGLSQIDTTILGLKIDAYNSAGVFMLVATSLMFWQTLLFFDGKDDTTGLSTVDEEKQEEECNITSMDTTKKKAPKEAPFNHMGVAMCMVIFYVHYYSFAVQETIITPLAMLLYRWDALEINLLFLGAGILSLLTSLSVRYLTSYVQDQTMLIASIFIGFLGSIILVDLPLDETLPVWRFLLGFSLITIAFPIGRNVILGIYGNVLGEVNQGKWMGIIIAISAFPRVIGPFISLDLLTMVDYQTWLEFGIIAGLFAFTLLVTWYNIEDLASNADFVEKQRSKRLARRKSNRLETICHPVPSPMLGKKLAGIKKNSIPKK